jgi:murein DD-endopeptidase MepM/ murein hydrolase activator NlpD
MDNTGIISFPKSPFTDVLVKKNNLDKRGFATWFFYPGMEFGAQDTWWGDRGKRARPHEGIDLCFYRGTADSIFHIDEKTKIPAMYDSIVVKIIDDFIGKTIIMKHSFPEIGKGTFLTLYGHTNPTKSLAAGQSVKAGEIIATLATPRGSKGLVPHLHLTLARIPEAIPPDMLDWTTIGNSDIVRLVDPLQVIGLSEK